MARANLLDELKRRVLLCDGAMGTQLMARGLAAGACGERWNVERPGDVEAIQRAYREAGCELITTNTFGGNGPALERHGLADRVEELNRAGAQVARKAAGEEAWVLGDVGPFGGFLEPLGEMKEEDLLEIFARQATALVAGGADAILVETMGDPGELAVAVRAAKQASGRPVIATYAFSNAGSKVFRTMMGTGVDEAVDRAIEAGADVVGANCGSSLGLVDYLHLAEQLVSAAEKTPVILQPNAGSPAMIDGKLVYRATPEEMGKLVGPLMEAGVRIIGGCCGTTPEHLRAMGEAVRRG